MRSEGFRAETIIFAAHPIDFRWNRIRSRDRTKDPFYIPYFTFLILHFLSWSRSSMDRIEVS